MKRNAKLKIENGKLLIVIFALCVFHAQFSVAQSGGTFNVTRSVVANGGGASGGGAFAVTGTIGQPVAGNVLTGGTFTIESGFWTSSASFFTVSGHVRNAQGRGVTNAVVTLDDNGSIRMVTTGRLGIFSFDGVQGGRTYLLRVMSRRFTYPNNPRMILVSDNIANEDFTANP